MHISKLAFGVAIVAIAPEVYGHHVWQNCIGDADPSVQGTVLGANWPKTPRNGAGQLPFQQDVPVLKNPVVPATSKASTWKKPRNYWVNGCGSTIAEVGEFYRTHKDPKVRQKYNKATPAQKNLWYFQSYARRLIDWKAQTTNYALKNQIVKVSRGGWIRIMVHQINADGAGPLKCKISSTGAPNGWNPGWIIPEEKDQVPGTAKAFSLRPQGAMQQFPFTVTIPDGLNCAGSYGGMDNICMMRCENFARNGPFGGCLPFQLVPQQVEEDPPEPDNSDNIGKSDADDIELSDDEVEKVKAEDPEVVDNTAKPEKEVEAKKDEPVEDHDENEDKEDDDDDDAATKRLAKRDLASDKALLAATLGGEAISPEEEKIGLQQIQAVPNNQKQALKAKVPVPASAKIKVKPAVKKVAAKKPAAKKPAAKKPAAKKPAPKKKPTKFRA